MTDLQKLMDDVSEWSNKTFGDKQRNPAILYHLKKEVTELIIAFTNVGYLPKDITDEMLIAIVAEIKEEYADCFMLLLDSAHHFGYTAENLIECTKAKLEINKLRKWGTPDENGVVEHIKDPEK